MNTIDLQMVTSELELHSNSKLINLNLVKVQLESKMLESDLQSD